MNEPLFGFVLGLLAFLGLATILGASLRGLGALGRGALRRWVLPRLQRRHERACHPLNVAWRDRLVRQARTGRVGMCLAVCVQEGGYRDLLRPRWTANVTWHAALAGQLRRAREHRVMVLYPPQLIERVPLGELTLAPSAEAAQFQQQMEETRYE